MEEQKTIFLQNLHRLIKEAPEWLPEAKSMQKYLTDDPKRLPLWSIAKEFGENKVVEEARKLTIFATQNF